MEAQTTPPHGTKRSADDALAGEQRLSKRFNLLNLEHNGKLFIPVPSESQASASQQKHIPVRAANARRQNDDWMQVEDTPNKIYIHNLDEELASDEETPEAERVVFLPDIEKQLGKIPQHILRGDVETARSLGTQLVLYSVPRSITVPEEKDNVRKAIVEARARARARARQAQEAQQDQRSASQDSILHDQDEDVEYEQTEVKNSDAMDME